ncbi:unnamed protein product [Oppiella nova]|uniref:Uncharacterized protein n=1 Tax=Oppiella nova TaxID=334625 RepID=A0A7R9M038_9ACAR|nr:unnamed protein product [Oppiella nova]CAG2168585.1 unnamed protein product [Oppiella nova]
MPSHITRTRLSRAPLVAIKNGVERAVALIKMFKMFTSRIRFISQSHQQLNLCHKPNRLTGDGVNGLNTLPVDPNV